MIVGYQLRSGAARTPIAKLKFATIDGHAPRYVGTGFSEAVATMLRHRLDRIATPRCPVAGLMAKAP